MFWFALACALSGLVLGWVATSTVVLAITSFQILAVLFGLWMGGVITGVEVVIWCISALFLHQGAFLSAIIAVAMRSAKEAAPSLAEQVDGDLLAMDGLVERIGHVSPTATVDTEKLRELITQMRSAVREDEARDNLREQQRRRTG